VILEYLSIDVYSQGLCTWFPGPSNMKGASHYKSWFIIRCYIQIRICICSVFMWLVVIIQAVWFCWQCSDYHIISVLKGKEMCLILVIVTGNNYKLSIMTMKTYVAFAFPYLLASVAGLLHSARGAWRRVLCFAVLQ